ncbi:hypothetical protein KCU85_g7462, partial [Aureobasidium melanogenum]
MKFRFNLRSVAWLLLYSSYAVNALPQPKDDLEKPEGHAKIYLRNGDDIQYAIDHASNGAQIFVGPGNYEGPIVIRKNGISLTGQNARIVPTKGQVVQNECSGFAGDDSAKKPTQAGICVTGQGITFGELQEHRKITYVTTPVESVRVSGFEVVGFSGPNIAVIGAHNAFVGQNALRDSPTYGCITAGSVNSRITGNTVTSSDLNFIGICMDDFGPVEVSHNDISGYKVGLCLQTSGAKVEENKVSKCCYGAFLDPKIDGVQVKRNYFSALNPSCPLGTGSSGIFIDGGTNAKIEENFITGMSLADHSAAGILIFDDPTSAARGNEIERNEVRNNDVDIFDGTPEGSNEFHNNHCATSVPANLCNT